MHVGIVSLVLTSLPVGILNEKIEVLSHGEPGSDSNICGYDAQGSEDEGLTSSCTE